MSNKEEYLKNLATQLGNMGHEEAARDVSSLKFDPLDLGFASGKLNLDTFSESGDDIEIDFDHIDRVLEKAKIYGFGGECGAAAVAINRVLFGEKGTLIAFLNKFLFEEEGEMFGHVAVKWEDSYWYSDGEKQKEVMEAWAMLDENDYKFPSEEDAYQVIEVPLSEDEVLESFSGCNLESMIDALNEARQDIENE